MQQIWGEKTSAKKFIHPREIPNVVKQYVQTIAKQLNVPFCEFEDSIGFFI